LRAFTISNRKDHKAHKGLKKRCQFPLPMKDLLNRAISILYK
jgi:hypothetical protein